MSSGNHPTSIEKIIERQIRSWELRHQAGREEEHPGRQRAGAVYFGPYLLISRERGSGARQLAALVGKRLGWHVFDREIVDEIARRARMRQQLIEGLDERARGALGEFVRDFLVHEEMGEENYIYHLKQVIFALGQQGDVVIIGRGAEYILPCQFGLRVRLVAPLDMRIERIRSTQGLTAEAARSEAERLDRERQEFIRSHFQHQGRSPLHYDLIINTGALNVESATEVVLSALEQKLGVSHRSVPVSAGR